MSAALVSARESGWGQGLADHCFGSLFSSPPWIEAVSRTYGFEIMAAVPARSSSADAAILFSHIRDLRGGRVVCLPFSDYCDPLVEDADLWTELVEPLLLINAPVRMRCLRNNLPGRDPRFILYRRAKWHGIDLARAEDELWAGLAGEARQNIRYACRKGVVVREGKCLEDIRLFHQMHLRLRKSKYRLLAPPFALFENIREAFSRDDHATVLIAERDGEPLAGIFLLQWRGVLYYKFSASFDYSYRPNELLLWQAILLGHRRGLAMLDLGLSDLDQPGLIRYKKKFATEEREIFFFEWLPKEMRDQRAEEASETLSHVTWLLTDPSIPDEITRAAGERFYRFFA
ncbi:GNAT family N-acetyltransferase [Inquilinus limosus]|uniref:GNAT family N-acetyltransferase n=1 Tax=Inquilinus limosus TaxID=171674 RepID=UPI003F170A26